MRAKLWLGVSNSQRQPCVFPFIYNGTQFHQCTRQDNKVSFISFSLFHDMWNSIFRVGTGALQAPGPMGAMWRASGAIACPHVQHWNDKENTQRNESSRMSKMSKINIHKWELCGKGFSLIPRHRTTALAPNHYNMISSHNNVDIPETYTALLFMPLDYLKWNSCCSTFSK